MSNIITEGCRKRGGGSGEVCKRAVSAVGAVAPGWSRFPPGTDMQRLRWQRQFRGFRCAWSLSPAVASAQQGMVPVGGKARIETQIRARCTLIHADGPATGMRPLAPHRWQSLRSHGGSAPRRRPRASLTQAPCRAVQFPPRLL